MGGKNIPSFILETNKSKTLTYRQFPAQKMGGRQIAMFQLNFHPPKPTLVKLAFLTIWRRKCFWIFRAAASRRNCSYSLQASIADLKKVKIMYFFLSNIDSFYDILLLAVLPENFVIQLHKLNPVNVPANLVPKISSKLHQRPRILSDPPAPKREGKKNTYLSHLTYINLFKLYVTSKS